MTNTIQTLSPKQLNSLSNTKLIHQNPLFGNKLSSRDDLKQAVLDFYQPLKPWFSEGNTRLLLGVGATHYDQTAAEMEAFVRPLWGIVPLLAGGYEFEDSTIFVEGFINGTDPTHPEYWGNAGRYDQRLVEIAGIAFALLLTPEHFWEPLSETQKSNLATWVLQINEQPIPNNNWLFFRILANLALRHVGATWSETHIIESIQHIDEFYIEDGYYRDGLCNQLDYYSPMGMHFYGLIFAKVAGDIYPEAAKRFRDRARKFAADFQYWFDSNGAAIPFGRSMTYRFAQAAFWSACAYADEEVLPWGRIKHILLQHLRWWSKQPMCDRDGVLSVGYSYPNLLISESYNAPGSPYWALKTLLVLALPDTHAFWLAEEEASSTQPQGRIDSPAAGFIVRKTLADTVALTGGQDGFEHRCHDAKYARFAYSSAFAFSVASDHQYKNRPDFSAVDNGLMISRDGLSWLSRSRITEAGYEDGLVWGRWQPDEDLEITSWLDFANDGWHLRLHKITTGTDIQLAEGGFSVSRAGYDILPNPFDTSRFGQQPFIRSASLVSGIINLVGKRSEEIILSAPNTHLLFPRSVFPRLVGTIAAGTTWLATAVYGHNMGALTEAQPKNIPKLQISKSFATKCKLHNIDLN